MVTYTESEVSRLRTKAKKLGASDLKKSERKLKKFAVLYHDKWVHFGNSEYEDFTKHKDPERRDRYRKRASKIKDKNGNYSYLDKNKPNYWAYHVLW